MDQQLPEISMRLSRALLLGVFLVSPLLGQEDEGASLRELEVRQILTELKGAAMPDIWRGADRLIRMGPPAKRIIQQEIERSSIEGQLAGLRALIGLDSPTAAADRLLEIAADEQTGQEFRIAALELVGKAGEEDAEEGLLEILTSLTPEIRIAAARALWEIEGERRQAAKQALREFLKASDPELRAQGALALAEMGDGSTPGVMDTLLDLRKEPGLRGKYASALYRNLKLNEAIQSRGEEGEAAAARSAGLWRPLDEIRSLIKDKYDLLDDASDEALRIGAARGMLQFPDDPHTNFMTPEEYREFLHGSDGVDPSYGGIGAFIDTNDRESLRILRPMFDGPAWRADIQGGDVITAVNGDPTRGKAQTEIIKQIKGPPGTEVILSIYREGWPEPREVKVIRAKIVIPTVYSRMLPGGIGYVQVAQFAADTGKELLEHLHGIEAEGLRGLVIDLRDNPGGLLQSVQEALTPFLRERELVCTAKGRSAGRAQQYFSFRPDRERGYPITVLVNGNSASGAELMSGVLQHYSKSSPMAGAKNPYLDAVVLGTATFGKGSMQSTYPLVTWSGERFSDEPRKDGEWEPGEAFTDGNLNNRWDPGEPFVDRARPDGRWNDAEPWQDKNGNGKRDDDESFTDENGDGVWNPAEPFEDANGDGEYDYGAAVKMSVARYYLPGGQNFTRKRVFDEERKEYVTKGGVLPDVVVEQEKMDVSDLVELRDLQQKGAFDDYVRTRWDAHKDAFRELAWLDGRDPSRYPDFESFYESLRTRLSKQEVRRGLRVAVRRQVSIESGKEIIGDLSDDNVLLAGVREILRRLGADPESIPEYHSLRVNGTGK
jgi:carboxyl-terminal processing protease